MLLMQHRTQQMARKRKRGTKSSYQCFSIPFFCSPNKLCLHSASCLFVLCVRKQFFLCSTLACSCDLFCTCCFFSLDLLPERRHSSFAFSVCQNELSSNCLFFHHSIDIMHLLVFFFCLHFATLLSHSFFCLSKIKWRNQWNEWHKSTSSAPGMQEPMRTKTAFHQQIFTWTSKTHMQLFYNSFPSIEQEVNVKWK